MSAWIGTVWTGNERWSHMGKSARANRKKGKNPLAILVVGDPKTGTTREKTVYTTPKGWVSVVQGGSPGQGKKS